MLIYGFTSRARGAGKDRSSIVCEIRQEKDSGKLVDEDQCVKRLFLGKF